MGRLHVEVFLLAL